MRSIRTSHKFCRSVKSKGSFSQSRACFHLTVSGQLNASDGENLLGYEIYSSSLADILSEPSLITPITVGLYAKWGSGKSFLLGKLQS